MRILFYTVRSLGQKGNAGTYLLVQEFAKRFPALSISNPVDKNTVLNDVNFDTAFLNPTLERPIDAVRDQVLDFKPDVVYLFNHDGWWETAAYFRSQVPEAKILLDVQTPLLQIGRDRERIQKEGAKHQALLDHIFALSASSAFSWIPKCNIEITEYPLGIDYERVTYWTSKSTKQSLCDDGDSLKLVYIGALAGVRKIEVLVDGVLDYAEKTGGKVNIDIYGSGETKELHQIIDKRDSWGAVSLKGLVDTETLFSRLPLYDVGMAWVPNELFSESPSLKLLEYAAAKIGILATDTVAHLKVRSEGYIFGVHGDSREEVCGALLEKQYLLTDTCRNHSLVRKKSYKEIIDEFIIPKIQNVLSIRRKIGFIVIPSLALGKGGAEKIATQLCHEMAKRKFSIFVVYKAVDQNSRPAYTLPKDVAELAYSDMMSFKFLLKSFSPDFCFCFAFNRDIVDLAKIIRKENIPFGFQECTNPNRLISNNWRFKSGATNKRLAQWEREIVASSAARIRLVMPSYQVSYPEYIRRQVRAFSNPCPTVNLNSINKRGSSEYKYIVSVNGLKENKNFLTLLRAFGRISHKFPDWKIIDVGKPLDEKKRFHRSVIDCIKNHGLQDNVIINGLTDDIHSWFYYSEFHVIASLSEGCPTVVLEAMACGVPSVGFEDCDGTNELINNNINGVLVSASNRIIALADSLSVLMTDSGLRKWLGKQALRSATKYQPEKIYDEWQRIFEEMTEYKNDKFRLLSEQSLVNRENALHAQRMLECL